MSAIQSFVNQWHAAGLALYEQGTISTSSYQSWKTVALMRGLGFSFIRDEHGDRFIGRAVEKEFDGWEPSADGSRITSWQQLNDSESPHFRRRYIVVFSFISSEGFEDVIAFSGSHHNPDELFEPVGLSSLKEWEEDIEKGDPGLSNWLKNNALNL